MHVQEPPGVWVEFLDPALRDRVIVGTREQALPIADGRPLIDLPTPPEDRREMRPTMMEDRYGDLARRGFDAPALLEGMDVEGVDVAALFPSYGLYVPWADHLAPELAVGLARSYNRWIVSLCADGDRRLVPVALAPLHDPAATAAEIRRAVTDDGVKAIMLRPNPVQGRPVSHPDHDRFFAEMVDLDIPVILHEGTGAVVAAAGSDRFGTWCGRHAASHPMEQMLALAGLIFDGVFERHPRLRVGVFESGTGWLRWWLHRLDEHWEFLGPEVPAGEAPAERVRGPPVRDLDRDRRPVRRRHRRRAGRRPCRVGVRLPASGSAVAPRRRRLPRARPLASRRARGAVVDAVRALQLDPASLGRGRALPRQPAVAATPHTS